MVNFRSCDAIRSLARAHRLSLGFPRSLIPCWVFLSLLLLALGAGAPPLPAQEDPRDLTLHWQVKGEPAADGETAARTPVPEALEAWLWSGPEGPASNAVDDPAAPGGAAEDGVGQPAGYRIHPLALPQDAAGPEGSGQAPAWVLEGACRPGAVLLLVGQERMTLPLTVQNHHCDEGVEIRQLMDRATVASRALPPQVEAVRRAAGGADKDGTARIWQAPPAGWLEVQECSMAPRSGRQPPPLRLPVLVPDTGDWWLPVPARECQHLTLKLAELSPTTWWGVILESGEKKTLESRRLKRGASILVQVTSDQDGRSLAGVEVAVVDEATAAVGTVETARNAPAPAAVATSGPWGWARLSGLGEGFYVVRARHEESGAMADSELLQLAAAGETVMELELQSPASLTVELDPEADLPIEDPVADVWLFEGTKESWSGTQPWTSDSPAGEPAVFPRLSPGAWIVAVFVRGVGFERQEIFSRDITLVPGEDRRLVVAPDRPLRQGRVLLRGEPVPGDVSFLKAEGNSGQGEGDEERASTGFVDARARSDAEGRFEIFLPAGLYKVLVLPREERRLVTTPPIEVAPEDGEIVVHLPGGRVSGWVVDPEGQPVTDPGVTALRFGDDSGERYEPLITSGSGEADGSFEVDALAAGSWQIQARSRDGREGVAEITLAQDELRDGVEIVVADEAVVSGHLITASGRPVAMARGSGFVLSSAGGLPAMVEMATDAQGRFELDLPAKPGARLFLQVTGPGIPVSGLQTDLGEELELVVPDEGGRVRLQGSPNQLAPGRFFLLAADGGIVLPAAFDTGPGGRPIVTGEGQMVIPALAVGGWRAIVVPDPQAAAAFFRGDFSGVRTLATFVVEPGGSVEVTLE